MSLWEERMQPFDEDYLARREKQIQDLFELRAMSWACVVTGLVLTLIALVLMTTGWALGSILFVVALLFWAGSIFMFASYFAQQAADRAIQREHDHLVALYGLSPEKPKRGGQEDAIWPSDDGELPAEASPEDRIAHREGQGG
jgi:hypothetical protein